MIHLHAFTPMHLHLSMKVRRAGPSCTGPAPVVEQTSNAGMLCCLATKGAGRC